MRSASSVSNNVEVLDLLHKRKLDETSSKNVRKYNNIFLLSKIKYYHRTI